MNSWVIQRSLGCHPLTQSVDEKILVMLRAYIDESGSHKDSHTSLVAGYYGSVNEWRRFERQWQAVLGEFSISEFHAKPFWAKGRGSGEFRDWTGQRREALIQKLVAIIENAKIYPFACGVLRSEWDKLNDFERRLFTGATQPHLTGCPSKPHFFGLQVSILKAAMRCQKHLKMHFVMDQDPASTGWAATCYRQLCADLTKNNDALAPVMGDFTFADSKIAAPLQAADMLAYEAALYAKKAYGGLADHPNKMRTVYLRIIRKIRSREDFWLFDATRIANWKRAMEETAE